MEVPINYNFSDSQVVYIWPVAIFKEKTLNTSLGRVWSIID